MPKKTPEPEQAPKADNYAKINMPAAFLTPHDIQTSDGRTFEKCFVSFPKGTKVNGIDVSGFSTDVFLSNYMKKDAPRSRSRRTSRCPSGRGRRTMPSTRISATR